LEEKRGPGPGERDEKKGRHPSDWKKKKKKAIQYDRKEVGIEGGLCTIARKRGLIRGGQGRRLFLPKTGLKGGKPMGQKPRVGNSRTGLADRAQLVEGNQGERGWFWRRGGTGGEGENWRGKKGGLDMGKLGVRKGNNWKGKKKKTFPARERGKLLQREKANLGKVRKWKMREDMLFE